MCGPDKRDIDMQDCRMVCRMPEVTCYIMDTYCRHITDSQRGQIDNTLANIYRQAIIRRRAEREDG